MHDPGIDTNGKSAAWIAGEGETAVKLQQFQGLSSYWEARGPQSGTGSGSGKKLHNGDSRHEPNERSRRDLVNFLKDGLHANWHLVAQACNCYNVQVAVHGLPILPLMISEKAIESNTSAPGTKNVARWQMQW